MFLIVRAVNQNPYQATFLRYVVWDSKEESVEGGEHERRGEARRRKEKRQERE